ncbi:DUF4158 domain-containing protein [Nonomuraea sp. H19]|uniref:DUF4158 domain-containing protein n=1 Tax=Nonomuraea sp. H19 TaxID=3452206 RepID=UPI003F8CABA7
MPLRACVPGHRSPGTWWSRYADPAVLDRAMEHHSPTLLFNLAREHLMAAKVIRPGALVLAKMVGTSA